MKKLKRSARLVEMTQYLLNRPHTLISLTAFADRYQSAKSSISEDLAIIKEVFEDEGIGELHTHAGAAGGVKYTPKIRHDAAISIIQSVCRQLEQPERVLPGGYLFMTDMLGQPDLLSELGRMFATAFANRDIDVIMTVETKGIPLAYATAACLNLPVVIDRRDNKVTEGSAVSINYVSGSNKRIQTMVLSKRSLAEGSKVLIIDDFMKAGGTVNGMISMLEEFRAHVAGIAVLVEAERADERLVDDYLSLIRLSDVDVKGKKINVTEGNYFNKRFC